MTKRNNTDPRFMHFYTEVQDETHHARNHKRDVLQSARGSTHFVISRLVNYIQSQLELPDSNVEHLEQKMLKVKDKKLFDLWLLSQGDTKTQDFLEHIAKIKLQQDPNSLIYNFIEQEKFKTDPIAFAKAIIEDPEKDAAPLDGKLDGFDTNQLLDLWKQSQARADVRQMIEGIASHRAQQMKKPRLQRLIREYKKRGM